MAESEFEIRRDEMERDSLQKTIADVETALAVSTPGTRPLFENVLHGAKGRLGALDKKIKDAVEARETHEREQAAVVALAEKETALNAKEKETYSGFLEEDFFTKKDFGRLEEFYGKTWDRLSERGKDEMSKRVWGGIRRGEFKFEELPPTVREKEMKQLHRRLTESAIGIGEAAEIPEKDRKEFIEAYEAGKKEEASKVLERESFKKTMFRDDEAKGVKSAQATREPEGGAIGGRIATNAPRQSERSKPREEDLDLSNVQLGGAKIAEAKNPPSASDIPQSGPVASNSNSLLRGG